MFAPTYDDDDDDGDDDGKMWKKEKQKEKQANAVKVLQSADEELVERVAGCSTEALKEVCRSCFMMVSGSKDEVVSRVVTLCLHGGPSSFCQNCHNSKFEFVRNSRDEGVPSEVRCRHFRNEGKDQCKGTSKLDAAVKERAESLVTALLAAKAERSPPRRAPAVPSSSAAAPGVIVVTDEWVQCDRCEQWRNLGCDVDPEGLPSKWFCSMNPDFRFDDCSVPQEEVQTAAAAAAVGLFPAKKARKSAADDDDDEEWAPSKRKKTKRAKKQQD